MSKPEYGRLRRLLTLLQRANISKRKRRPTFMEVAGVEHREITISRILAFLLDSEAEHGLGELWLQSLLRTAEEVDYRFNPVDWQLTPSSANTEIVTADVAANLRIDVVVETPDVVLGIENKIGASLYNDLGAYAGQIRNMADKRAPLLLTLTLNDETAATSEHLTACAEKGVPLCNVTYASLFAHVKEDIGEAILTADPEWLGYVRDFMRTIENLGNPEMQFDRELFTFVSDNRPEINLLRQKMEEVTKATKAQGGRFVGMLLEDEELSTLGIGKPRTWQPAGSCGLTCSTYYDIPMVESGQRIHPELSNVVSCLRVQCWVSNGAAKTVARAALENAGYQIIGEGERHLIVKELPLETGDSEAIEELRLLITAVLPIVKR